MGFYDGQEIHGERSVLSTAQRQEVSYGFDVDVWLRQRISWLWQAASVGMVMC